MTRAQSRAQRCARSCAPEIRGGVLARFKAAFGPRRRRARHPFRDESGMVLVEFTIVAPLLLLLVFGAIQGGLLIYLQHEMTSAARETTRRMAVGELKTTTAAESFAQTRMANTGMGLTFTYAAAFPTPPSTSATMTISISMANATIIDVFGHFGGGTLTGFAAMRME